jgi:hypothetical protein
MSVTPPSGANDDVIGYIYHVMAISVCYLVSSPLSAYSLSTLKVSGEYELTGRIPGSIQK